MKQRTEVMLCAAFMELLRKNPFPKITIQKIAQQCGVNRQTFYYHYDNIYDLLEKAIEYELVYKADVFQTESWEMAMRRLLLWMRENKPLIKNLVTNVESQYLRRAIYPLIEESMSKKFGADDRSLLAGRDSEREKFVRNFLVLGMTQYILAWMENDCRESVEEITRNFYYIIKKVYDL